MRPGGTLCAALALALAGALASGCAPGKRERLTVAVVPLPAMGLLFIAQSKGYFAAHGIELEQRRFVSGRDAVEALGRGEVEAAIAYETPVILRASVDRELDVLTTLHTSTRSTRLVARADRGILRDHDLAGKRVGVPRNTDAETFLLAFLEYAAVPAEAVRIVDVSPEAAGDLLAAGDLDAIAIWPPHAERARRLLGADRTVEISTDAYTEISMLVTRDPVHDRRRQALVELVRGLSDAERLARDRPDEALEALAVALPDVPRPELREAWGRVHPTLGLSHLLAYVLENEWARLRASGRLSAPIDLGDLLEPDVLAEVDPEAVTLVLAGGRGGER